MAVVTGMYFQTTATMLMFDVKRWSQANQKAMFRAHRNAARAWLAKIGEKIPKDTGFLLSGFENLSAILGVRLGDKGQVKRGRNLYGQDRRLTELEKQRDLQRERLIKKGYAREEGRAGQRQKLKPTVKPPMTTRQKEIERYNSRIRQERKRDLKAKEKEARKAQKGRRADAAKNRKGLKEAAKEEQQREVGSERNIKTDQDRKSKQVYAREKNEAYYRKQQRRRQAAREYRKYKRLQRQVRDAQKKAARASRQQYKTVTRIVEREQNVRVRRSVEEPNPGYSARAVIDAKRKGIAPPPKTIKVVKDVIEKKTTYSRKKVLVLKNMFKMDQYKKYYYPQRKVKGPVKSPFTGMRYGTPYDQIFTAENEGGVKPIRAQELTTVDDYGKESATKQSVSLGGLGGGVPFTPGTSLDKASADISNKNAKFTIRFQYGVDIKYWRINDLKARPRAKNSTARRTPWGALTAANISYMAVLKKEIQASIVPFSDYIVSSNTRMGGFQGSK